MQEYEGTLASGNRFRVTTYLVEVTDTAGDALRTVDVADVASVTRASQTVTLRLKNNELVTLTAASLDDAGRIETILRAGQPPQLQQQVVIQKKGGFFRWVGIGCVSVIGVILIAVVIGAVASSGGDDDGGAAKSGGPAGSTRNSTNDEDVHVPLREGSSGEIEPTDGRRAKITIVSITDDAQSSNQFLKPASGNKYWAVEVVIEDVGAKAVSSGSWKLRTTEGFEYDRTFVTDIGKPLDFTADITPGGKIQGTVVFEIPSAAEPAWLRYDPNVFIDGDLFFDAS